MSINAKHTPGPWGLDTFPEYVNGTDMVVHDKDGFPIATIKASPILNRWEEQFPEMGHWAEGEADGRTVRDRTQEELEANAHLIAAAPDLLAALEEVVGFVEAVGWTVSKARAAIAKARGE